MVAPAHAGEVCQTNPNVDCLKNGNGDGQVRDSASPSPNVSPSASASPSASSTPIPSSSSPTPVSATPTPAATAPAQGDTSETSETTLPGTSSVDPSTRDETEDQTDIDQIDPAVGIPKSSEISSGTTNTPGNVTEEVAPAENSGNAEGGVEASSEPQIDADQAASPNSPLMDFLYTLGAVVCLILAGVVLYLKIASDRRWKAAQNKAGKPKAPAPKNIQ